MKFFTHTNTTILLWASFWALPITAQRTFDATLMRQELPPQEVHFNPDQGLITEGPQLLSVADSFCLLANLDNNTPMQGVKLTMGNVSAYTNADGYGCLVPNPPNQISELIPGYDTLPMNGVDVFDVLLIRRHLLGLQPIASGTRRIAADINSSGSITSFDAVELMKRILHIYQEFPNKAAWTFMSQPTVGFLKSIVGIKTGDIDNSVIVNENTPSVILNDSVCINFANQMVQAGDTVTVTLFADQIVPAIQMSVYMRNFEFLELQKDAASGIEFGVFQENINNNLVTIIPLVAFNEFSPLAFTLKLKAQTGGNLHDLISINSYITPAIAYLADGTALGICAPNTVKTNEVKTLMLHQLTPNPWCDQTQIRFDARESGPMNLSIMDIQGRLVYQASERVVEGTNIITLNASQVPVNGIYMYHLDMPSGRVSGKMVVIR